MTQPSTTRMSSTRYGSQDRIAAASNNRRSAPTSTSPTMNAHGSGGRRQPGRKNRSTQPENQWEHEIPVGKVRNNPFVPKRDAAPTSPQLRHPPWKKDVKTSDLEQDMPTKKSFFKSPYGARQPPPPPAPSSTTSSSNFTRGRLIENPLSATSSSDQQANLKWDHKKDAAPRQKTTTLRKSRDENKNPASTDSVSSDALWHVVKTSSSPASTFPEKGWGEVVTPKDSDDSQDWSTAHDWDYKSTLEKQIANPPPPPPPPPPAPSSQLESSKHTSLSTASTRDRDVLNSRDAKQRMPADSKSVKTEESTKPKRMGIMKFFGNVGKSRKKKSAKNGKTTPLAAEMMEIGSEATVTARDLMRTPPSEMSSEVPGETVASVAYEESFETPTAVGGTATYDNSFLHKETVEPSQQQPYYSTHDASSTMPYATRSQNNDCDDTTVSAMTNPTFFQQDILAVDFLAQLKPFEPKPGPHLRIPKPQDAPRDPFDSLAFLEDPFKTDGGNNEIWDAASVKSDDFSEPSFPGKQMVVVDNSTIATNEHMDDLLPSSRPAPSLYKQVVSSSAARKEALSKLTSKTTEDKWNKLVEDKIEDLLELSRTEPTETALVRKSIAEQANQKRLQSRMPEKEPQEKRDRRSRYGAQARIREKAKQRFMPPPPPPPAPVDTSTESVPNQFVLKKAKTPAPSPADRVYAENAVVPQVPILPQVEVKQNAYHSIRGKFRDKDKLAKVKRHKGVQKEELSPVVPPPQIQRTHRFNAEKARNAQRLRNHFASKDSPDTRHGQLFVDTTENSSSTEPSDVAVKVQKEVVATISDDKMTMLRAKNDDENSMSLGSATTDFRTLSSMLQRPRCKNRGNTPKRGDALQSIFACYDESKIRDPMQRAGLRLLSQAVIPIQQAARRFLAQREALTRLWAILVVQAQVRVWLEQRRYAEARYSVIAIQAASRGLLVRQRQAFEEYCAIEIQRHVRGYLSSIQVYDEIYKITLVQSIYRMRSGMQKSLDRMWCIILIQSVARQYLTKKRLKHEKNCAIQIQRYVRGYLATVLVYEDIYRITVIQNLVRMKRAIDVATIRMACVITIQAAARGWVTRRRVERYESSAVTLQRYIRGYLATMRVYEVIYKIMLVQNYARMKAAVKVAVGRMAAVITIQTIARGFVTRNRMMREQHSAITIQRYTRGYIATVYVYEEIYKVTLIQSHVRMFMAMDYVATCLAAATRLQAVSRGFLIRLNMERVNNSVTLIQSSWRCFAKRLQYQFVLLDIIITQSIWRRKKACRVVAQKRIDRIHDAAVLIQTHWRGYDMRMNWVRFRLENLAAREIQARWRCHVCVGKYVRHKAACKIQSQWRCYDATMDYLHFLADVLIVQSTMRRWLAIQYVEREKGKSAILIQKTWRGFVCFADYMFTLADIVILQALARRWLAGRVADYLRLKRFHDAAATIQRCHRRNVAIKYDAAVAIQRVCRGFIAETRFYVRLVEFRAARVIQAYWRRFWLFSNYIIGLDCAIRIQALVRGFVARCQYADTQWAATLVQTTIRGYLGRRTAILQKFMVVQLKAARVVAERQQSAMTIIQKVVRGTLIRDRMQKYNHAFVIQRAWRRFIVVMKERYNDGATTIQKNWRRCHAREIYLCLQAEYLAATIIQTAWRGYLQYTNYLFALCDIVKIQAVYRSYRTRSEITVEIGERKRVAATAIQKAWRGYSAFQFAIVYKEQTVAAVAIQKTWRCFFGFASYAFAIADIVRVQSQVRRFLVTKVVMERAREKCSEAATTIQTSWRMYFCNSNYKFVLLDIVKVQSALRRFLAIQKRKAEYATRIQKAWRGFFAYSNYAFVYADVVRVQRFVRHCMDSKKRRKAASIKIQGAWRGFVAYTTYFVVYADIVKTQCIARSLLARRELARRKLEDLAAKAVRIQAAWRVFAQRTEFEYTRDAVLDIQRYWRGYRGRIGLFIAWKEHINRMSHAAALMQSLWRGYKQHRKYLYMLGSAIQIQSVLRMMIEKARRAREVNATVKIQAMCRACFAREIMLERLAVVIQHQSKVMGLESKLAVCRIQRAWRRYTGPFTICRFMRIATNRIRARKRVAMLKLKYFIGRIMVTVRRKRAFLMHYQAQKLQRWYLHARVVRRFRRNIAARKILHFLLMVKAEVDKAIRAEKKRRKIREKMRNRTQELDDSILETAWIKATETGVEHGSRKPRKTASRLPVEEKIGMAYSGGYKLPPSRMRRLTSKEIDDDFNLEEAWIDAEISDAKERRRADKRSKNGRSSRSKKSSNAVATSSRASRDSRDTRRSSNAEPRTGSTTRKKLV